MNKQDQFDEDLLKRFINPERIEKAPEGFTSRNPGQDSDRRAISEGLRKEFS